MSSNLKSVLEALTGTAVLMLLMWALFISKQPTGEYQELITFNSQSEYNDWCKTNDTYIPYLHWNWWQSPSAQVTVWVRYDWWGSAHYTDTGKNIAKLGGLGEDNDKTD